MRQELASIVSDVIELASKSVGSYLQKLATPFTISHKVFELLNAYELKFKVHQLDKSPLVNLTIEFGEFKVDSFHINYNACLKLCQYAKFFVFSTGVFLYLQGSGRAAANAQKRSGEILRPLMHLLLNCPSDEQFLAGIAK